jgi:hypothetical protein
MHNGLIIINGDQNSHGVGIGATDKMGSAP